MAHTTRVLPAARRISGWTAVGLIAVGFLALFVLNFFVPLQISNLTTRLWRWTELALAASAAGVILARRRELHARPAGIAAALGLVSGLSHWLHDPSLQAAATEAAAVWLTFVAGWILFRDMENASPPPAGSVAACEPPAGALLRRIGLGALVALPFAAFNNLFFFLQNGAPRFENIVESAAAALSPGIHEEAVFRYFILAFTLALLRGRARPRLELAAAVTLSVVPHSLLHLPDLFLENPVMAVVMLLGTSLIFGLPMALLQVRRSFESAVAFHWAIDFVRFWFGY